MKLFKPQGYVILLIRLNKTYTFIWNWSGIIFLVFASRYSEYNSDWVLQRQKIIINSYPNKTVVYRVDTGQFTRLDILTSSSALSQQINIGHTNLVSAELHLSKFCKEIFLSFVNNVWQFNGVTLQHNSSFFIVSPPLRFCLHFIFYFVQKKMS